MIIPGTFKGMLKGNGYQIIGQKAPLFATLNGATVENLKLTQGKIEQKTISQVAALAKTAEAGATIKNVYVRDMTVTGQSSVAGMVAVLKKTTVEECSVNATVNGQRAGGLQQKFRMVLLLLIPMQKEQQIRNLLKVPILLRVDLPQL